MSEPRAPYNVDVQRTQSLMRVAAFEARKPALRAAGYDALQRLARVARGDTGQSVTIAKFLLSVYNGTNFPLDVSSLRTIDIELHEDCLAIIMADYSPQTEIHHWIENGREFFEQLAVRWAPIYAEGMSKTADTLRMVRERT